MISYILRIISEFQQEHGYQPNLLYLNEFHLNHLKAGFADDMSLPDLCDLMKMELIITGEVIHPHVAWTQSAERLAV